jgi:cell division protein FtsQ
LSGDKSYKDALLVANKRKYLDRPATPMVQKIAWVSDVMQRPVVWVTTLLVISTYLYMAVIKNNDNLSILPINSIEVVGELHGLKLGDLETAISSYVQSGFFSVDVNGIKAVAEQLPWAKTVSVRRVWPDKLQIEVTEQNAIARWKDDYIINEYGFIFKPDKEDMPAGIARLDGPEGSHLYLLEHYQHMQTILSPLSLQIAELSVDDRRAMRVQLKNGLELFVGKVRGLQDSTGLMTRFAQVYQRALQGKSKDIVSVDLRYTNGISVQWKQKKNETRTKKNA